MLQAIERICRYTKGKNFEDFIADDMMYYAVVKNIEILGEASNMLTEEFRQAHPKTPWKQVNGMRNYIVHEYFQVDNNVVWDVITNDLPILEQQIKGVSNRREVKNIGQAKSKPTWFCLRLTDCHIFIVLREFLPNKNYKRLLSSLPAPVPLYLLRLALKLYVTCKEMLRV